MMGKEVKVEKFYQLKQSDESNTDLFVYGDITSLKWEDSDIGAFDIAKELSEVTTESLTVHINSYGGEVAQGLAMYNLLKQFKGNVTTVCDGFACSAASVVFMSGKSRIMNKASLLMVHNAWTYTYGNAEQLRKAADDLDKVTEPSIQAYMEETGLSREAIVLLLKNETWLTPDEALEYGFATQIKGVEAMQSTQENLIYSLVTENKSLKKEVEKKQLQELSALERYLQGGK